MSATLKHIKQKLAEKRDLEEVTQNVKVVVRVRPMSQKEREKGSSDITQISEDYKEITVTNKVSRHRDEPRTFSFDQVFPMNTTQHDFYNQTAKEIVENVIKGYNGTIFAYGQTGAGKTFTMEGLEGGLASSETQGVIPKSFAHIFDVITNSSKEEAFLVRVSYMEIYNEDIRDLLSNEQGAHGGIKKLHLKENEKGLYVEDLTSIIVEKAEDMSEIMALGKRNRSIRTGSVASTNMNSVSSRSHAIFTISIERSYKHTNGGTIIRMGKLNLVDLAGSERLSKTGASGDRLKEATKINLSLSNLGIVISALIDGNSYIPYRNSKLTRLLSDSLGGNSMTVMCANIGPADYNYDETVSTLRYASRASAIKNTARINEDPKDALLKEFQYEMDMLRQLLAHDDANPLSREELQEAAEMFPYFGELAQLGGGGSIRGCKGEDEIEGEDEEEEKDLDAQLAGMGIESTDEAFKNIKGLIETQKEIVNRLGTAKKDKKRVMTALKENLETYHKQQEEKNELQERIKSIQRKILVGGVNLLDKSEEQEAMLLKSKEELELKRKEEEELKTRIQSRTEENQRLEEEMKVTQERNTHITKRIKKLWESYRALVAEMELVKGECEKEMGAFEEQKQINERELRRARLVIETYIPPSALELIKDNMSWNEASGEYDLRCVAYAGNNVQNRKKWNNPAAQDVLTETPPVVDLSYAFQSLDDGLPPTLAGGLPMTSASNTMTSPPPPGYRYTRILLGDVL